MADRYWRGGTGTWNSSNTANWSATSGGAGGASVPTTSDDVYFNASSGSGTVTISGTVNAASVNFTGATLTLAGSGANMLNYVGSFTMGSGITIGSGLSILRSSMTTLARTFTSAGKTFPWAIQFYGTGGSITFQDALTCTGGISQSGNHTLTWGNFTHTTTSWYQDTGTSNFTSPGKVVCSRSTAGSAFSMPITSGFNNAISAYNRFEVLSPPAGITVTVDPGFRTETTSAKLYYINSGTGTIQTNGGGTGTNSGHAWLIDVGAGSFNVNSLNGIRSVTASASWTGTYTGILSALSIDATGTTINLGTARTNTTGTFFASAASVGTNPIYIDTSITFTTVPPGTTAPHTFTNGVLTLRNNSVLTLSSLRFAPTLTGSGFNFGTGSEKLVLNRATPSGDVFFVNTAGSYTNVNITNRKAIEILAPNSGVTIDIKLPEGIGDRSKLFSFSVVAGGTGTIQFNSATGTTYASGIGVQDFTLHNSSYTVTQTGMTNSPAINGDLTIGGSLVAANFFTNYMIGFTSNTSPQTLNTNGATVNFGIDLANTAAGELRLAGNTSLNTTISVNSLSFGLFYTGSGQGYLNLQSFRLTCGSINASTSSGVVNINFGASGTIRCTNSSAFASRLFLLDTAHYGTISGNKVIEVEAFGTFAQNYIRYYNQSATTGDYAKALTVRVVNTGSTGIVGDDGHVGSTILEDGPYAFNGGSNQFAQTVNVYQNLDILGSSINFVNGASSSTFQFAGGSGVPASNVNTYGSNLNIGMTVQSSGKQVNLAGATTIRSFDLLVGALSLSSFTLTCTSYFNATNSGTARDLNLGTGSIYLTSNATGTVFNVTNITSFTLSGTSRKIYITTPGTGFTKTSSVGSSATINFDFEPVVVNTGGTINFSNGDFRNFDIPGGTYTIGLPSSYTIYGDLTVNGAITAYSNGGTAQNFAKSSGTQFINTNGNTYGGTGAITFNVLATTLQLSGNCNFAASVFNHNQGTLALNNFRLTVPSFSSTSGNTRTINFGTSGAVRLTGSGTVWTTSNVTGLTISGTNRFVEPNLNGNQTLDFGILAAADTLDVSVPTTASNNTLSFTAGQRVRNLSFANVAYTVANINQNIYGNLTVLGTTPVFTAGTSTWTFLSTSGTQTITSNGNTFNFPITCNVTGTLALGDNLTIGSSRTFDLTTGTLDLGTRILSTGAVSTTNSNVRAINFGAGSEIRLTGTSSVWNSNTSTNLTVTGTTRTIAPQLPNNQLISFGAISEANAFDVSVPATAGNFTLTINSFSAVRNINFANATYTVLLDSNTIFGSFTVAGTSPTFTSSATAITFGATSGSHTITTNGETIDLPITINAPGATYSLGSALTLGSTRTFTLTQGTFNTSNFNVTSFSLSSSGSSARTLTLGSSIWTILGDGSTAWNITTSTNMTFNRGTSKISMSSASNKTFNGGGLTYGILEQAGAGTLTITGTSNRFADLQRSFAGANTITMPGSVTTFFDNFTLTGVSAVARTTLNSSGTSTISKSSGTVSVDFLSISSSNATGGATWYAGNNSVNGGGNTGWIFTAPPQASGNMLMVFM
jgi:hypothetical protein